jgi:hypothetical protein
VTRLDIALDLIRQTREYTHRMLETLDPASWFSMPPGCATHVAWQVGHLAMAQYFLCLLRIRGERPEDKQLISDPFVKRFGRESVPDPIPAANPTPVEIREVFDRVHRQALLELPELSDAALDEAPVARTHPLFNTKLGSLLWCPRHEMSHVGQIGLLRRMMGQSPMW